MACAKEECELFWKNEPCVDNITFCEKTFKEYNQLIKEQTINAMINFFETKAICVNEECIHLDDEYNCVRCIAEQMKKGET